MLQITYRHMASTDSLREVAEEKFARISTHFAGPVRCHLVIDCRTGHARKGEQFTVHADLTIGREDTRIDANVSHAQAACAVREVFVRLERQLASRKERRAVAPMPPVDASKLGLSRSA